MSRRLSRQSRINEERSVSRIEHFEEENATNMNQPCSSISFVRRVNPQREIDVFTVRTETTTKVHRIRKKKKSSKVRVAGEASLGSFTTGPQYQHLETSKQQFRGVTWLTTEIANLFPRTQKSVETALGELLIYALFVIVILIVIVNLNVHGKYHYGQYLKRSLTGRPQNYGNVSAGEIKSFHEILNQRQMFRYLNDTFIKSEFMDYFYERAKKNRKTYIKDFNNIIGSIQIRQFRMSNNSCTVPEVFKKINMSKCYGEYSEINSDKQIIQPLYDALTAATYAAFSIGPFHYTEPESEYDVPIHGQRSIYPGSGGFLTNYMSTYETTKIKSNLTAEKHNKYLNSILYASGWIRRESRVVIIEILNYNPSMRMMGQAKILFEYLPEGGILPSLQLNIIRVNYLQTAKDYFMLGITVSICAFLILFIVQEIREIAFFGWKYIIKFWSWVDIAIIVSGIAANVNLFSGMIELKYRTQEYFSSNFHFSGTVFRIDNVVKSDLAYDECMCWLLFFTCLKILRYSIYFGQNDRFSRTLNQASSTLIAFAFRYGIAFIAFAQFGYFLFGTYVESYSTFSLSCLAIIRFNFGYIDYDELIKVRGALGLIYVLLLLIYLVGYMMAFLLVILYNFYTINESEVVIKRGPTAGGMCCSWCTRLKHYFRRRKKQVLPVDNITTDELLDSLDILNFTDPEIDLFQIKYKLNEKQTSEPEYVSKILWNVIEEIQTDVKKADDHEVHRTELEGSTKNDQRKPLYTKQYNALVKQMKNLEIQAEILFEKTTRSLATARIGRCMFQPQSIKDECSSDPIKMKK